jgi:phosphatidylserine decarboxylase
LRPKTEGIGTVRSNAGAPVLQDSLSSDEEYEEDEDLLAVEGLTPVTPMVEGEKTPTPPPKSVGGIAKFFPKRVQSQRMDSSDSTLTTDSSVSVSSPQRPIAAQDAKEKKRRFRKSRKAGGGEYLLNPENDVLGIVMLEIKGAKDLPKLSNSMCLHLCSGPR